MRKLKITFLFLGITALIYSCSKTSTIEPPEINTLSVNYEKEIDFKEVNDYTKNSKEETFTYTEFGKNKSCTELLLYFDQEGFKQLNSIFTGNAQISRVIFYTNINKPTTITSLHKDFVTGISVFTIEEDKIYHRLFEKKETDFIINESFTIEANRLTTNQIDFVMNEIITMPTKSFICISNTKYNNFRAKNKNRRNEFYVKMAAHRIRWKEKNTTQDYIKPNNGETTAPTGCGDRQGGCAYGLPWTACTDFGMGSGYQCYSQNCAASAAREVMVDSSSWSTSSINTSYDLNKLTTFRDSFLYYSPYGLEIVDDFYALSNYLDGHIDLTLATSCATELPSVLSCIDKLTNDSQNTSVTLLTSSTKSSLISVMNDVKAKSSDTDFITIINNVISDLNYFSGQSVGQVRLYFDNN